MTIYNVQDSNSNAENLFINFDIKNHYKKYKNHYKNNGNDYCNCKKKSILHSFL